MSGRRGQRIYISTHSEPWRQMKADSLHLAPEVSGKESSEPTGQKAGGLERGGVGMLLRRSLLLLESGIERRCLGHQVNILSIHTVAGYFITCTE